ncbi:MAG: DUF421 domain-containing protein [Actinobacteria bacterium]|nr:DUF421 domain-containing protein [Actinomycetota bacterium]
MWAQLGMTWSQVWLTIATAVGVYAAILALSRLFGQRQFASLSTYDLAFNFAMGSLIGRTVLVRVSLLNAVVALCTMFVLHAATGWLHHHNRVLHDVIQNRPVLLVSDGRLPDDALHRTGTSHVEVFQAARLQGLGSLDDVAAVTLERNGQFSFVPRGQRLDPDLFGEVAGNEALRGVDGT